MNDRTVLRHSPAVRLSHWLIAASGLLLCISGIGFMPLYGRFYVNELPGMAWVSDFETQMHLHYLGAALFSAAACFHLVFHVRRGERAAWPGRGDVLESWRTFTALVGKSETPRHGKFLAEQRLAYAAMAGTATLLILTGLFLSGRNAGYGPFPPELTQGMILLHLAATFLFIALVAGHLMAFLPKSNRPLLRSMITGRVEWAYARRRHPRWRAETREER